MAYKDPNVNYEITEQFEKNGYTYKRYTVNGHYREDFFYHDFQAIRDLALRDDDVFLATYQRSGTTLTQRIMLALKDSSKQYKNSPALFKEFPFLEARTPMGMSPDMLKMGADMPSPRWVKTHLPTVAIPVQIFEKKTKLIHVYRAVKDTIVSSFHFYQNNLMLSPFVSEEFTFNEHFDRFMAGVNESGDWFAYHKAWFDYVFNEGKEHCLVLSYKQITQEKEQSVTKIASFVGIDPTEETVRGAVDLTSVTSMKEEMGNTVRRGESDAWREYLSDDQSRAVDDKARRVLGEYAHLVL
jgi:hypothetical protein